VREVPPGTALGLAQWAAWYAAEREALEAAAEIDALYVRWSEREAMLADGGAPSLGASRPGRHDPNLDLGTISTLTEPPHAPMLHERTWQP